MSMKIKGRLMDKVSSRVETAYAGKDGVIHLTDVPCELTFKTGQAFVEHEDEKHHYLPCFKLRGIIDEVRGEFPYNISCIYFGLDDQAALTKTVSYYPSPKELAHMITVGCFYSRRFEIPDVIRENTYSFPALVDLTIVPPPNPSAYEAATYDPMADELDINSVNLPVVYVKLKGSGVTRKTDPLLDYYGIDMDGDFQMFAMTAESSGYREPQLLEYIPEPEPEPEPEQSVTDLPQKVDEAHFITPEEEAELLADRDVRLPEQQEDVVHEFVAGDPEDALLTQLSRDIDKRVHSRYVADEVTYDKVFAARRREHSNDLLSTRMREKEAHEESKNKPVPKPVMAKETPEDTHEKVSFGKDARVAPRSEIATPVSETKATPRRSLSVSDIMAAASAKVAERNRRLTRPDDPEKMVENKMDFNSEANTFVQEKREAEKEVNDVINKDDKSVQEMNGADVADTAAQARVNDMHTVDVAKDTARSVQERIMASAAAAAKARQEAVNKQAAKTPAAPDGSAKADSEAAGKALEAKTSEAKTPDKEVKAQPADRSGLDVSDVRGTNQLKDDPSSEFI